MNCMELLENNEDVCQKCGCETNKEQPLPFIPQNTLLEDRYIVGKGLEIDGEGLSYIGYDETKRTKVYIREFYPANFSSRAEDGIGVTFPSNFEKVFKNLRTSFLKYFRFVARVRNLPAIVSVYDIFEANNTVYVICEWIEGCRLDRFLSSKGGRLEWNEAKDMFMPFLSSLSRMEAVGIRHLGISPDNILVTKKDNQLRLTGFATKNLRSANSLISSQLYDGCTALEQYLDDYEAAESTDVYGFASTLFFALTGEYPPSALERKQDDKLMMPQIILNNLPENVVSAIATALRVYPNSRTLSFETLKIELSGAPLLEVQDIESDEDSYSSDYEEYATANNKSKSISWGIISCVITLVVLLFCLGVYWFWLRNKQENKTTQQNSSSQTETYLNDTSQNETAKKITVPNLIERNFKTLQEELKYIDEYKVVLLSEEFSGDVAEGCIISQTPSAGEEAYYGAMIAVNVSKGSKMRSLPSIEGKTLSEASQLLAERKLKADSVNEFSDKYPEGTIIGYKSHKAGDEVEYGSQVTIIVSKGAT